MNCHYIQVLIKFYTKLLQVFCPMTMLHPFKLLSCRGWLCIVFLCICDHCANSLIPILIYMQKMISSTCYNFQNNLIPPLDVGSTDIFFYLTTMDIQLLYKDVPWRGVRVKIYKSMQIFIEEITALKALFSNHNHLIAWVSV